VHDCLSLKFFAPYPILASSFTDGSVYLWGVRPLISNKGECFFSFKNCYNINNKIENIAITCSLFLEGNIEEIKVDKKDYFEPIFDIPKKEVNEVKNEDKKEKKPDLKSKINAICNYYIFLILIFLVENKPEVKEEEIEVEINEIEHEGEIYDRRV
jgi:hypothetical protein